MAWRGLVSDQAQRAGPATDLKRWSLEVCEGRQVWRYLSSAGEKKQNDVASRYHCGLPVDFVPPFPKPADTEQALHNAIAFFSELQTSDGHWAGDYGGPMFLLPGFCIACRITGVPIEEHVALEMIRYLTNLQTADGGWGIHIESEATVFGTALNYVVMRILGVPAADPRLQRAREWLQPRGGCLGIPSWGKFWLAVLGVYSWDGVHSLFPEMALLPEWFPLHTRRLWSYCRTVYMPMTYLYGLKFVGPVDELVRDLRTELIFEKYETVNWRRARSFIAPCDLYTPHTCLLETFFVAVDTYEHIVVPWIRRRALAWIYEVLQKEDEFTNFIDIGPVNKVINMICVFVHDGPDSAAFKSHVARLPDYLWLGRDGMKMNGTNGSQLWDTSFMVQAMAESRLRVKFPDVFRKAHDFVDLTQIRHDHPDHSRYYRDVTKGGWPFSTRDMGWIVADCTGEGLKAALLCKLHGYTTTPLSDARLADAANILLLMQNDTGGWATCEKTRGGKFFEYFNASEVFGEIMIDYDYVECSSSALQALCLFRHMYPGHRAAEVSGAIARGVEFMLGIQRADGSWEGLWGVGFTYGTWFGVEGLLEAGLAPSWGETFASCVTRAYVQHERSQVVNTAWAVLTLLKAKHRDRAAIERGVQLLRARQLPTGDWAQESISGVFNKNCMISYSNYKNIFPLWALARYVETYSVA